MWNHTRCKFGGKLYDLGIPSTTGTPTVRTDEILEPTDSHGINPLMDRPRGEHRNSEVPKLY